MPKAFYTERDIEDMVTRGILSLEINDNVVLTNAAYEKAITLGMQLLRDKPDTPPTSPVRPYITDQKSLPPNHAAARTADRVQPKIEPAAQAPQHAPSDKAQTHPQAPADASEIRQRIRNAVFKQLGNKVDPDLLDVIITRVFENTGIK